MKTIDFSEVPDLDERSPVPEGPYRVEVYKAKYDTTQGGGDYLKLRLHVTDGEHAGAILNDQVYFTERALPRLKLILKALRIDTEGELTIGPELLKGKTCLVDVIVNSYVKTDGSEAKANAIPFAGYHATEDEEKAVQPF